MQLDFGKDATFDKFMGAKRYLPTWTVSTSKVRLVVHATPGGAPAVSEFRALRTR